MTYVVLKLLHIVAVTMFFGAGLCSVFVKLHADRTGDPHAIAFAHRVVVAADWVFTIPSGVALPLTGLGMMYVAGYPLSTPWIAWGFVLYVVAGLTWLPAWRLQFKMRDAAVEAARAGTPLPAAYHRWTRTWALLGVPSFFAAVGAMWMMVSKGV